MSLKESANSTPSEYAPSTATAEDLIKSQTVGLVNLSDFRKRRAEALEQHLWDDSRASTSSGISTLQSSRDQTSSPGPLKKKTRKKSSRNHGKLSFALEEDETGEDAEGRVAAAITSKTISRSATPVEERTRLRPNAAVGTPPRIKTKAAMEQDTQLRGQLRKEFAELQEKVKATEISIPFVFYDGTNIPGGISRVKKGDHVWLFLDRCRKVGAELGVGGGDRSKREWARVAVDDLMLVRGQLIIPHHYDFYYFILNKTKGTDGKSLFDFSDRILAEHEGTTHDPSMTKVVDRRWYEKNKHIYPASVWEEFDPKRDYSDGIRKDAHGNTFFFS